jgi:hypothetical protein
LLLSKIQLELLLAARSFGRFDHPARSLVSREAREYNANFYRRISGQHPNAPTDRSVTVQAQQRQAVAPEANLAKPS